MNTPLLALMGSCPGLGSAVKDLRQQPEHPITHGSQKQQVQYKHATETARNILHMHFTLAETDETLAPLTHREQSYKTQNQGPGSARPGFLG